MKKAVAEKYRDIDFSRAKRGVKPEPGKTKISIRLVSSHARQDLWV